MYRPNWFDHMHKHHPSYLSLRVVSLERMNLINIEKFMFVYLIFQLDFFDFWFWRSVIQSKQE